MSHSIDYHNKTFQLERYPQTSNRSLLPFSNAELLAMDYCADKQFERIHLFNDRFGVWSCAFYGKDVTTVIDYASQKKAIHQNLELNGLVNSKVNYTNTLDDLKEVELALIKIPKSLGLFELHLQQIHKASTENTAVVCAFMTKYFSASLLKIAAKYFDEVSQTKAWKKSRLLVLKSPKTIVEPQKLINSIQWKDAKLQQYYGVFSSRKIDIGTQFLLENLALKPSEKSLLDLASGNGVIAFELLKQNQDASVTLIDDSYLAVASSKLNIPHDSASFVCDDTLEQLSPESFDLVVSNPPFHFEYENNVEVSLNLFKGVVNCLKQDGRFVLVANKHLNYTTHLRKLFATVVVLAQNDKFEILECSNV